MSNAHHGPNAMRAAGRLPVPDALRRLAARMLNVLASAVLARALLQTRRRLSALDHTLVDIG